MSGDQQEKERRTDLKVFGNSCKYVQFILRDRTVTETVLNPIWLRQERGDEYMTVT